MLGIWTLSALSMAAWAGAPAASSKGKPPMLSPDAQDAAVPSRHYDIVSLNLDLALDFPKRRIGGTATYTVQQLSEGDLILDQVALNIQEVTIDGDGAKLANAGGYPGGRDARASGSRWAGRGGDHL